MLDPKPLLLEARREVLKALSINGVTCMTLDMIADMAVTAVLKLNPDMPQVDDPLFQHSADPALPPLVMTKEFNPDDYLVLRSDRVELGSPLTMFEEPQFILIQNEISRLTRIGKAIRHTLRGHLYLAAPETVMEVYSIKPVFCFIAFGIAKKGNP